MRTHTVHIALSQRGESQIFIGAGLTINAAKEEAAKSLHPLVQLVKAQVKTEGALKQAHVVMAREPDGSIFLDRVSATEPTLAEGEFAKLVNF